MRRPLVVAALLGLAAAAGAAAWRLTRPAAPVSPRPLSVYFTCDLSGRIEPCGCFSGQYGGLTRISTVLAKAPEHALIVDVGDALAGLEDYHVLQHRHLLAACARLGFSAANLGRREARLSATQLRELAASSPVPLLSSNVVDSTTGEPVVRPWVVVEKGGVKYGLVGVTDPDRLDAEPDPSVKLLGMTESLRRTLEDVRPRADVLLCLAFTDMSGLERLAREFYEIRFFLGGDVRQPSQSLAPVNQGWILAVTNQSRALGEIHAQRDPLTGRLSEVRGDVTLMADTIAQDPAIEAFAKQYRHEVRTAVLAIDRADDDRGDRIPGVNPAAEFVGSAACAGCHPQSFEIWSKSSHAHAFETLIRRESEADPNCIGCHVIGFGEPGGYRRSMQAERLTDVGCESCHGPGSEHIRIAAATPPGQPLPVSMRPVGAGQCVQCHHGEFSRPFHWDAFWPLIEHGKERR